ncbi:hypothetical protein ABIC07_008392 [Bradyrhizobium sp. RT9a]
MRQSLTRLTKAAERIKGVIVTSDEADNRYLVQVAGGEVQLTPANPLAAYHKSVLLFVPSGAKETIEAALSKHARWTSPLCARLFREIPRDQEISLDPGRPHRADAPESLCFDCHLTPPRPISGCQSGVAARFIASASGHSVRYERGPRGLHGSGDEPMHLLDPACFVCIGMRGDPIVAHEPDLGEQAL